MDKEQEMKKKPILIGGIIAVLLLAAGGVFVWQRQTAAASSTTTRQTTTVARGELTASVSGAGNISAPETSSLSFGVGDVSVTAVNVQVGSEVRAGDVLATANAEQYDQAVKNAQVTLQSAQLALKDLQEP